MPFRRLSLLLVVLVVGLAGCGGDDGDGQQGGPAGGKAKAAPELRVLRPDAQSTTRASRVQVEGTVTSGAFVEVNGKRATIEGPASEEGQERWSAEVPVKRGRNVISIEAELDDGTAREQIVVVRKAPRPGDDDASPPETADTDPGGQGGPAGESGGGQGGAQGDQGGAGGSQGGAQGTVPDQGNQGGSGGSTGGDQGGSGGSTGGDQGGSVGGGPGGGNQGGTPGLTPPDGGQGGPPAAPPPSP